LLHDEKKTPEEKNITLLSLYRSIWLLYDDMRFELWMNLTEWLERLTANTKVATFLGSIPASFDTMESEGQQIKQC
jgi:hypothetical protein